MSDASRILQAIEQGDPLAVDQLLPLVYDELRRMSAERLAQEKPGQSLDATGLVHEAYLRLVGDKKDHSWQNRAHFFAAAAEAMRRILIDNARRKHRICHGGEMQQVPLDETQIAQEAADDRLLAIHEALDKLAAEDATVAEVVKLRYFVGMTIEETAEVLGISVRTANRHWAYARAWLFDQIS